jgi:hypothetical protein
MSERIYRLLLRLYPSEFRQTYGEEAVLLFRDRMQDERGFFRHSRLWLDLLLDLGAIRIRGYRETAVAGGVASTAGGSGRLPSFASLEVRALEFRFLVWGGFLSLLLCSAALFALQHGRGHLPVVHAMLMGTGKTRPKIVFSYEPSQPTEGSTVRVSAKVSSEDGPVPTGKVNFLYGWNVLATGTLVNGSATMEVELPEGKRLPLNALYPGNSYYNSVSSVEKDR